MIKKNLALWYSAYVATALGLVSGVLAHAQNAFTVPTSTAETAMSYITAQLSDPGTLLVVAVAVAIPLFFYAVHQIIGLFPKSRGARRS